MKVIKTKSKRVGRGYGSGKGGHTTGRGMKGQKARAKIGILFEGLKTKKSLLKRLPLRRGKGKFKAKPTMKTVNLRELENFSAGSKVNIKTLIAHNVITATSAKNGVKILGTGIIKKKLTVELPISANAARKIKEAGGTIVSGTKKE